MSEPLTMLVPARDEAATIARVVSEFSALPWVGEVLVVDNGSEDNTGELARLAGARVVDEPRAGMGYAVSAGLAAASYPWVMKVDADLELFNTARFAKMSKARAPGVGLIKGVWQDPDDDMPMTRLLVKPAVARVAPGLSGLSAPNSGIYLVDRRCVAHAELVGGYAADLDLLLRVYASGAEVREVDIGQISHDMRDVSHYNAMAATILNFFMDRAQCDTIKELVVVVDGLAGLGRASLAFMAAHLRRGALVHLFVSEIEDEDRVRLAEAFAPYPTFRFHAFDSLEDFRPIGPDRHLRLIAPYPIAPVAPITRTALGLYSRLSMPGSLDAQLLLMPPSDRHGVVQHFRPDYAFDCALGVELANAIRAGTSLETLESGMADGNEFCRATFQSFASLPGKLKLDLTGRDAHTDAVGPGQ